MDLMAINLAYGIEKLLLIGGIITVSLIVAMYTTYAERKIAAWMQDRVGPNRAGPFGLLAAMGVDKFLRVSQKTQDKLGLLTAEQNALIEKYVKQL